MNKKKYIVLSAVAVLTIAAIVFAIINKPHFDSGRLIKAIENNDIKKVESLLEKGIDPNIPDAKASVLFTAVESSPDRPINVACDIGNYKMVKLLIDYGATVEYREGYGHSPLRQSLLCCRGEDSVKIVKLLIENGADVDLEEQDFLPVFQAAWMAPSLPQVDDGYNEEIAQYITEIVEIILEGKDVNIKTDSGKTLLMYAAWSGNLHLIEHLISKGCDLYAKDDNGQTAYDYAVKHNKSDAANLLEHRG